MYKEAHAPCVVTSLSSPTIQFLYHRDQVCLHRYYSALGSLDLYIATVCCTTVPTALTDSSLQMPKFEPSLSLDQPNRPIQNKRGRKRKIQYVDASTSTGPDSPRGGPSGFTLASPTPFNLSNTAVQRLKPESEDPCGIWNPTPPPARRSSPKLLPRSRTGCVVCRIRKKKVSYSFNLSCAALTMIQCDEKKPVCTGCFRINKGLECAYDMPSALEKIKFPPHILRQMLEACGGTASLTPTEPCSPTDSHISSQSSTRTNSMSSSSSPIEIDDGSDLHSFRKVNISSLLNPTPQNSPNPE
jgi:hypothetical protein